MLSRRLYISTTDAIGHYLFRGMATEPIALEELKRFSELRPREDSKSMFVAISSHDGRVELRRTPTGQWTARITAASHREQMLWGLLPAREAMIWEPDDLAEDEARRIVSMLFTLPREAFTQRVAAEMAA